MVDILLTATAAVWGFLWMLRTIDSDTPGAERALMLSFLSIIAAAVMV